VLRARLARSAPSGAIEPTGCDALPELVSDEPGLVRHRRRGLPGPEPSRCSCRRLGWSIDRGEEHDIVLDAQTAGCGDPRPAGQESGCVGERLASPVGPMVRGRGVRGVPSFGDGSDLLADEAERPRPVLAADPPGQAIDRARGRPAAGGQGLAPTLDEPGTGRTADGREHLLGDLTAHGPFVAVCRTATWRVCATRRSARQMTHDRRQCHLPAMTATGPAAHPVLGSIFVVERQRSCPDAWSARPDKSRCSPNRRNAKRIEVASKRFTRPRRLHWTGAAVTHSAGQGWPRSVRVCMSAKPSRLSPRQRAGSVACSWVSLLPIPQTRSRGLASTRPPPASAERQPGGGRRWRRVRRCRMAPEEEPLHGRARRDGGGLAAAVEDRLGVHPSLLVLTGVRRRASRTRPRGQART
jgi:hypothetical protein